MHTNERSWHEVLELTYLNHIVYRIVYEKTALFCPRHLSKRNGEKREIFDKYEDKRCKT